MLSITAVAVVVSTTKREVQKRKKIDQLQRNKIGISVFFQATLHELDSCCTKASFFAEARSKVQAAGRKATGEGNVKQAMGVSKTGERGGNCRGLASRRQVASFRERTSS